MEWLQFFLHVTLISFTYYMICHVKCAIKEQSNRIDRLQQTVYDYLSEPNKEDKK
jgi:hypothetical protein